ncbi:hypothetical protein M569_09383, partial [Genlisea aurea]
QKVEEEKKKPADGGEKKGEDAAAGPIDVVLKLDLHCEGCAKKVRRAVSNFDGVDKVKADTSANKLIVTGNVDPVAIRELVEAKTKKKVDLVSPQPKKDAGGGDQEKKPEKKTEEKKADKPKEPAVATVVLKVKLHCEGCAHKIRRTVAKNVDGVESVKTDLEKDLVTVTGTMDPKQLVSFLQEKIKRTVEIVPPPKKDAGGDKKEKDGGGGEKKEKDKESAGGEKKEKKEGGGDGENGGGGGGGEKNRSTQVSTRAVRSTACQFT